MTELWQLYDEQGRQLTNQGGSKDDVFSKGLLHGAAHVWIWRPTEHGAIEVLVQKRSADKRTWPNTYDISAACHIDLGEDPLTAALRETAEEIGITVVPASLTLISVQRAYAQTGPNIENELDWLYLLQLSKDNDFKLQPEEVSALEWKSLATFKHEVLNQPDLYVPHGKLYFDTVIAAIESAAQK